MHRPNLHRLSYHPHKEWQSLDPQQAEPIRSPALRAVVTVAIHTIRALELRRPSFRTTAMTRSTSLYSCVMLSLLLGATASAQSTVTRYVRYQAAGRVAYGILEQSTIHELSGDLFAAPKRTGKTVPLAQAKLLAPVQPKNVIAVGLNYKSHLGERQAAAYPGLFAKYPTSIVGPDDEIVRPADSKNLHYEGELVLVIGKRAKNVPEAQALDYVFGVTAG